MNPVTSSARIRELNDAFRRSFCGGRVVLTRGVVNLPPLEMLRVLDRVRKFDDFDREFDPDGEHDFGAFFHADVHYFWKIDCYDLRRINGSPDPSDPAVTSRVLTIMRADEY